MIRRAKNLVSCFVKTSDDEKVGDDKKAGDDVRANEPPKLFVQHQELFCGTIDLFVIATVAGRTQI